MQGASPTTLPCVRCGAPRARGKRNPARYCAPACRKSAFRYRVRWRKAYEARRHQKASPMIVAAVAAAKALELHRHASVAELHEVAMSWQLKLTLGQMVQLLQEMVDDGVLESVAGEYAIAVDFVELRTKYAAEKRRQTRRVSASPERGSEVARSHRPGDGFGARSGRHASKERRPRRAPKGAVPSVAPTGPSAPPPARLAAQPPKAAPTIDASEIHLIAGPRPDGGTWLTLQSNVFEWDPSIAHLAKVRCRSVDLPPTLNLRDGDGESVVATVHRPERGVGIALTFSEEAQLTFLLSGRVKLEMRAHGVWRLGMESWLRRWLSRASWWATGANVSVDSSFKCGWRVGHLEAAADFVGLKLFNADVTCFTSRGHPVRTDSEGFKPDGRVETITVGTRRPGAFQVTTHDKSQWLRKKGLTASTSVYAAEWEMGGYDGSSDIRRIEVRGSGSALRLRADARVKGVRSTPVDLQDPVRLLDEQALRSFVSCGLKTVQLVVPRVASDLGHRLVDPRWERVASLVAAATPSRLVVDHARARSLSDAELDAKDARLLEQIRARMAYRAAQRGEESSARLGEAELLEEHEVPLLRVVDELVEGHDLDVGMPSAVVPEVALAVPGWL